jgi:hypothetical protein
MTKGIRWRIFILQIGLIGILAFVAGFAFWASSFAAAQVHDQLAAQKVVFPATTSAAFKALPAADQSAMAPYAGQLMTTGVQAQTYSDHFIAVHLSKIGGGKTYAQFPSTGLTPAQTAQKTTLFQGETLRGLLLNAYGWSQLATYAFWAAVGLAAGAFAALGAFVFELVDWRLDVRKRRTVTPVTVPVTITTKAA